MSTKLKPVKDALHSLATWGRPMVEKKKERKKVGENMSVEHYVVEKNFLCLSGMQSMCIKR